MTKLQNKCLIIYLQRYDIPEIITKCYQKNSLLKTPENLASYYE